MLSSRNAKADYTHLQTLISKQNPSPAQYDNFNSYFDKSKQRSFTIGKKFETAKSPQRPGPANYNTRQNVAFSRGGQGSSTGQKWTFGSENRTINKELLRRANKIPACTDYSPQSNFKKKNIKIMPFFCKS